MIGEELAAMPQHHKGHALGIGAETRGCAGYSKATDDLR
jgi:hypothetical protein